MPTPQPKASPGASRHEEIIREICTRVRSERQGQGWSLQQVADAADVHRNTVWRFEMGSDVSLGSYLRICEALKIDPRKLIGDRRRV